MNRLILVLLLMFGLALPSMAENRPQRVLVELSMACIRTVNTDHSMKDVVQCLYEKEQQPQFWRPGWSNPTEGRVLKILGGGAPIAKEATLSPELERTQTKLMQAYFVSTHEKMLKELFTSPKSLQPMSEDLVNQMLGKYYK